MTVDQGRKTKDGPPEDLAPETVKLARYIQALPCHESYAILLTKLPGELLFCVENRGRVMSAKR